MKKKMKRFDQLRDERRIAAVMVDLNIFADIVKSGVPRSVELKSEGLPDDALFIGADYLPMCQTVQFSYLHESFEPVQEGRQLPQLMPTMTWVDHEAGDAV